MGYPGLKSLELSELYLEVASVQLTARTVEISYTFENLRNGRVDQVVAAEVLAILDPGSTTTPISVTVDAQAQTAAATPAGLNALLMQVPADQLQVNQLEFRLPARGLVARGNLSLDSSGLEAALTGLEPEFARDLSATIMVSNTGILKVAVQDPDPRAPSVVRLEAEAAATALDVQGTFSLTGYGLELIHEAVGLPPGAGLVCGTVTGKAPWPMAGLPDWQTIAATGQLDASWSLVEPAVVLQDLSAEFALNEGAVTIVPSGSTQFSTGDLDLTATFAGGTFEYRDGFMASDEAMLNVSAKSSGLQGEAEVHRLRTRFAPPFDATLNASLALRDEATLVQGLVNATLNEADGSYQGQIDFVGQADLSVLLDLPDAALREVPLQLAGSYSLRGMDLTASADLTARSIRALPLEIEHSFTTATGTLTFSHTQSIRAPLLVELLPGWQAPYDLDSGRLDVSGALTWGDGLTGSFDLEPHALVAHYDDYTVFNTAGRLSFRLLDSSLTLLPSVLTAEALDIGFPVTKLEATVSGPLETLTVSQASAEIFGGYASIDTFDYQIRNGNAELTVALTDIDLAEILALQGDKISGTGRLSGTIPVSVQDNRVYIESGTLAAGTTGIIQVSPTLSASINQPGLDIALKALENFRYDTLGVNVDYDDEGDMLLGVRLEGRNPELEGGRPVHFNLNISQNVPVLLRSLRLQDNFTKTIERRLQR
jgi:hypothetical protein